MKILIIGSNPSSKNIDPTIPFKGTKSQKILSIWMDALSVTDYVVLNVLDKVTENNRTLTRKEIREAVISLGERIKTTEYDKIIALGNTASEALKLLKLTHYKLPHPSGRNRLLNSKKYVDNQLESCKVYLYENK